jgi:hypothetical protein
LISWISINLPRTCQLVFLKTITIYIR